MSSVVRSISLPGIHSNAEENQARSTLIGFLRARGNNREVIEVESLKKTTPHKAVNLVFYNAVKGNFTSVLDIREIPFRVVSDLVKHRVYIDRAYNLQFISKTLSRTKYTNVNRLPNVNKIYNKAIDHLFNFLTSQKLNPSYKKIAGLTREDVKNKFFVVSVKTTNIWLSREPTNEIPDIENEVVVKLSCSNTRVPVSIYINSGILKIRKGLSLADVDFSVKSESRSSAEEGYSLITDDMEDYASNLSNISPDDNDDAGSCISYDTANASCCEFRFGSFGSD